MATHDEISGDEILEWLSQHLQLTFQRFHLRRELCVGLSHAAHMEGMWTRQSLVKRVQGMSACLTPLSPCQWVFLFRVQPGRRAQPSLRMTGSSVQCQAAPARGTCALCSPTVQPLGPGSGSFLDRRWFKEKARHPFN